MEVPQLSTTGRPDNLTARLVAIIIHEMTTCISRWREYAASKDAQLQQLHKDNQQYKARVEAQDRTINAQAELISHLEMEMSPIELSCGTMSPAAFSMSLQGPKTSDSIADPQPSFAGETLQNSPQKTYGQSPDGDNADISEDAFAPLMALAMTAAEDIGGQSPDAGERAQPEIQSPRKRGMEEAEEEADALSKRGRYM
ncbi:hypothetical protein CKAH01_15079 [Colletotrichum kahawae]|uniref:Uncharacterized protein n=1 Tax=Colletotrichum kahawae TaxID=34407 RepID=A0AAD9YLA4_COLKA|nr:hypothetical protein CKAH01_15079 [Colletotrichum kahawae]